MRIALCDDCKEDALALRKLLEGQECVVYDSADSLLADVEGKHIQYDLYLLDIFMEESISGIQLAERVRGIQEEALICFVSTSDDFYREAYDLYAMQYLLKPVRWEDVKRLLKKAEGILSRDSGKKLIYSWRGKSGVIPCRKIRYITSSGHRYSIHCTDGSIQEGTGRLGDVEQWVCGDMLMRCHQSFIVNMRCVEALVGTDLSIGGEQIPVSRRYYAEVKKRYQEILFEEVD